MNRTYLDNAATTPVAPEVRQAIDNVNEHFFGNPSSIHSVGSEARKIVDQSRMTVSSFVGCKPSEIIFTSGGSESDNLAIRGIVEAVIASKAKQSDRSPRLDKSMARDDKTFVPHVITSAVEHHAVLHTVQDMERAGLIEATYIKPDQEGLITAEMVKAALKENTVLATLIYVNNETGVVTPISQIGLMLEKINKERADKSVIPAEAGTQSLDPRVKPEDDRRSRIYFHTDAVQAAEFFHLSPDFLKVDLLTLTAHKIHGPKGVGLLYVREGTPLKSQISGGDQEFRKRAGTENVAGMAGFAKAVELIVRERAESKNLSEESAMPELITSDETKRMIVLRDKLIQGIVDRVPNAILNGSELRRSPHIVNMSFINAEGEAIILNLDFLGIAVSSGSACTSRSLEPSHVLTAMGIPPEKAHGSIRFSLSRYTTEEEVAKVVEVLPGIIEKLRAMSPFK